MNYAAGEIIRKDVEKAVSYFNLAAAQGHPTAMYYLGLLYSSELNDSNAAVEWLEKAVAAGYEQAKEPLKSATGEKELHIQAFHRKRHIQRN